MEGKILVVKSVEGETPVSKNVDEQTTSLYVEEGTPFDSKGATPTLFAEGEIPGNSEGATPTLFVEGETPIVSEGKSLKNLRRRLRKNLRGKTQLCLPREKSLGNLEGMRSPLLLQDKGPRRMGRWKL